MIKNYSRGNQELVGMLNSLVSINARYGYNNKTRKRKRNRLIISVWKEIVKEKEEIRYRRNFELYEHDYWTLTNHIDVDLEIGKEK